MSSEWSTLVNANTGIIQNSVIQNLTFITMHVVDQMIMFELNTTNYQQLKTAQIPAGFESDKTLPTILESAYRSST